MRSQDLQQLLKFQQSLTCYNRPAVDHLLKVNRKLIVALGLAGGVVSLALLAPEVIFAALPLIVLLGLGYLAVRLVFGPLPRLIAGIRLSIRWKVLGAVFVLAVLSILVSLINIGAMDYMHTELHEIQEIQGVDPGRAQLAVNELAEAQHGPFFSLMPFLSLLGALAGLGLGVAVAVSLIDPVRRMGQAMRRIAAGDFSEPVHVSNRDELGELAQRINSTARELARLQEATLAEERARALRERIAQVTLAQEEERRRISRELHDDLGPSLAAVINRLRRCQQIVRSDPQVAEMELEQVAGTLRGSIQDIRHLIYDLRPPAVDQLGLLAALQQQLEQFTKETGIRAFSTASGDLSLDPLVEVSVFRVVQECLSNIQKHADASQVEVELRSTDDGLEVRVEDNGSGFDPGRLGAGQIGEGVGLLSMRERAGLVGGRLSVDSSPGRGCRVVLSVPHKEEDVGAHKSLAR